MLTGLQRCSEDNAVTAKILDWKSTISNATTAVDWQLTFIVGSWIKHCVERAGVTGCCIGLTWGCTRTGDFHYNCRAAVRSKVTVAIKGTEDFRVTVIIKSTEHCRVTVTIRTTEHFRVTVAKMSLNRQYFQYVYLSLMSCELLNSVSGTSPKCVYRTLVCWG